MEGIDWEMRGLHIYYDMFKNGEEIVSFQSENTKWGERSVLKIADSIDALLALSVVMTISYVMNASEDGKHTTHL